MKILPNGYFSVTYTSEELSKGLRPTGVMPRNNTYLTKCNGAVGFEGVLKTLSTLSLSTVFNINEIIQDDFPFPQLFITDHHVIVCNRTSILEYNGSAMEEVLTGITTGGMWSLASSFDFVYLSNGVVAVIRNPENGEYAVDSDAPIASAIGNFNGQILVGINK